MARKTLTLAITAEGRDKGKHFLLTELPALRAEKWAARAFLALAKAGVDIPDDVASMGLAGIAQIGLQALSGLDYQDAEPLLDEMLECVQTIPDPARPEVFRRLIDDDIEEVATIVKIRAEVWALHTGFSLTANRSDSVPSDPTPGAPNTSISPPS